MAVVTPAERSDSALRIPRWINVATFMNLVFQIGIIVTGGAVRLTGSGLGCPTWPECVPGSYTPTVEQAEGFHKWIEFGNRTLTGVLLLGAIAVVIAVLRHPVRRKSLVIVGVLPLVLTLVQAVIGGVTVIFDLHPNIVGVHFLVSGGLVAVSTVLWQMARTAPAARPRPAVLPASVTAMRITRWALAVVTTVMIVLGTLVTGAGPHSGDANSPRLQLDPKQLSWLHADAVLVFVGVLVAVAVLAWVGQWGPWVRTWLIVAAVITVAQGVLGYVQYFTGLPELLVGLHMLGAALVIVAVAGLSFALQQTAARRTKS